VVVGDAVLDLEHLLAAGGEEKIVFADGVLGDGEHGVGPVGVEDVVGGEVEGVVVVDGSAAGEGFGDVVEGEGEEVGDLLALGVDDFEVLVFFEFKGDAGLCGDVDFIHGQAFTF